MAPEFPQHLEFVFGDVFDADDRTAQFIVSLAAAANDCLFLHGLWFPTDAPSTEWSPEQGTWFMRQAMSQLWEVRELMRAGREVAAVSMWLGELEDEAALWLGRLDDVLGKLTDEAAEKRTLVLARQHTMHYPPPGSKALQKAMRSLAGSTERVVQITPAMGGSRASFADAVMFRIAFEELSQAEFRQWTATVLQPGTIAVMNFGVRAYATFIREKLDALQPDA